MLNGIPRNAQILDMVLEWDNQHTYWNGGGAVDVAFKQAQSVPGSHGQEANGPGTFRVPVPKVGHVRVQVPPSLWGWIAGFHGPILPCIQFSAIDGGSGGYGYLNGASVKLTVVYRA
jgi:hypothetical protein